MNKSKLAAAILIASLTGCAVHVPVPRDVRLMPNDCANRTMIINYLTAEGQRAKSVLETESDYERHRTEIRQRIWTMRYHCQPV
jgi:hypothetical protein